MVHKMEADKEKLHDFTALEQDHSEQELVTTTKRAHNSKMPVWVSPGFLLFWAALFVGIVLPAFNRLPTGLSISQEASNKAAFIAERAQQLQHQLSSLGPHPTGSSANENLTVNLLLNEIENVRGKMLDLFELEVDVQQGTGSYLRGTTLHMYQGVQNVVVKLSTIGTPSDSYLLVNSHFDSKPGSPGAGDAGHMVVSMLEVLRKMATTRQIFEHPIVFLFNGAEENGLQGSHAFITQHKWAKNCKALINLDAAGSGGREVLFQSGPNNPWLMKYYKNYAVHPFATTLAEEIFQMGVVPSDTDFRIFRDYGHVPGLDLALVTNGYVYHTKFDSDEIVPRGSLQNTGDNLLSLVRGFANATEMHHPERFSEGHAVFYDFLGIYFVYHTVAESKIYNYSLAATAFVLIFIALWRIASVSRISHSRMFGTFVLILMLQVLGFALGLGLPFGMAFWLDSLDRSLSYYSSTWLIVGLFIVPSLIGLGLPITLFFSWTSSSKVAHSYRLQMALHGQCILLAALTIALTLLNVRSAYLCAIALFFYIIALTLNLVSTLSDQPRAWVVVHSLCQVPAFLYISYLFYTFTVVLVPMGGRSGSSSNPDLLITGMAALGTVLAMSFVMPLINLFRRPILILLALLVVALSFQYMAASTQIGFPYRPKTSVQRVDIMHVKRTFYERDGNISLQESGHLFDFNNRRMERTLKGSKVNLTRLQSISKDCSSHMKCGFPLYLTFKSSAQEAWMPSETPIEMPGTATLELVQKQLLESSSSMRFEFVLTGPPDMSLFIQPMENTQFSNWSFMSALLASPAKYPAPYYINLRYGNDNSPRNFSIDVHKANLDFDVPLFEIGVSAHYVDASYARDEQSQKLVADFPAYAYVSAWPSSYDRYIF